MKKYIKSFLIYRLIFLVISTLAFALIGVFKGFSPEMIAGIIGVNVYLLFIGLVILRLVSLLTLNNNIWVLTLTDIVTINLGSLLSENLLITWELFSSIFKMDISWTAVIVHIVFLLSVLFCISALKLVRLRF